MNQVQHSDEAPDSKRAFRFEVRIEENRCKGCELCVEFCPTKTISMGKKLNKRGRHYACVVSETTCTGCLQCADICPDAAITILRIKQ